MLGIGMIYTLTAALLAALFVRLLGQAAVLAEIQFLVALNFPSAGGSVPESMLPPFWQVIHSGWVGAGAYESMRSVLFFDGNDVGHWMVQLLIWTAAAIVLLLVTTARGERARNGFRTMTTPCRRRTPCLRPIDRCL